MDGFVIAGIVACVVLVTLLILVCVGLARNKKKAKKEVAHFLDDLPTIIVQAMGGLKNIESCEARMSRLTLVLVDSNLVDKGLLEANGMKEVIIMEKKVVLVIGQNSGDIATSITNLLSGVKKN